jgi:SAM-dependent methyltransferase
MSTDEQRRRRRRSFDDVAALYGRVRPGYPDPVFDDLWELSDLGDAPRVLEIGCGTGQATLPLLRRGASVLAVEIGTSLAELARAATREYGPRVEILTADFDNWTPPMGAFDLAVAATAFHWLDPDTRCRRIALSLRDEACLAVLSNEHVSDGAGDEFFHRSQAVYADVFGGTHPGLPKLEELEPVGLDRDLFELVSHRTYPWAQPFDSASYLETLATYSDHHDLPDESLEKLLFGLEAIIDDEMGGKIEKHWAAHLTLARRR